MAEATNTSEEIALFEYAMSYGTMNGMLVKDNLDEFCNNAGGKLATLANAAARVIHAECDDGVYTIEQSVDNFNKLVTLYIHGLKQGIIV